MRIFAGALFSLVVVVLTATCYAQEGGIDPPAAGGNGSSDVQSSERLPSVVNAVVVRSWGSGSGSLVWEHLNQSWSLYGTVPVLIDYTTLHEVAQFTLEDLENAGADVVIVSDPAGNSRQWTGAEATALQTYAEQGHNLVGTYLLLQHSDTDNRMLAPLWGLRSDLEYLSGVPAAPSAPILATCDWLFANITDPFDVGGYPYVQVPADGSWDEADMNGATLVARSDNGTTVVTAYDAGQYQASYVSFMPEHQDGSDFEATQYLYNAIAREGESAVSSSTWGGLKSQFNR